VREHDDTRSNAETESLALAYTSISLCVFEARSVQHEEKFLFRFLLLVSRPVSRCTVTCRLQSDVYLVRRPGFSHRYARRAVVRVEDMLLTVAIGSTASWHAASSSGGNRWNWLFYFILFVFIFIYVVGWRYLIAVYVSPCMTLSKVDNTLANGDGVSCYWARSDQPAGLTTFQPPTGRDFRVCGNKKEDDKCGGGAGGSGLKFTCRV